MIRVYEAFHKMVEIEKAVYGRKSYFTRKEVNLTSTVSNNEDPELIKSEGIVHGFKDEN